MNNTWNIVIAAIGYNTYEMFEKILSYFVEPVYQPNGKGLL